MPRIELIMNRCVVLFMTMMAMPTSFPLGMQFRVSDVSHSTTELKFDAYAPLATFGGTPKNNDTLILFQPAKVAGCEPFTEFASKQMKNRAIFLMRGHCSFVDKVRRVQASGAAAVVIGNTFFDDGSSHLTPDMGPLNMFGIAPDIKIPAFMVSSETALKLSQYFSDQYKSGKTPQAIVICTHNSRRSHLGQLWLAIGADFFELPQLETFSGGTEATAFNPRAVAALHRVGFGKFS